MADDKPSLHIDTDWKKQAQEEKKRLAEQSAKAKETAPIAAAPVAAAGGTPQRRAGQIPQASFAGLVQTLMTQALYYLGDLASRSGDMLNLDMAKLQIDMLAMLEDKTRNNLVPDETKLLDTALYETRMRFVSVATQLL